MIDHAPSPRGEVWIVDPPGIRFTGLQWHVPDAGPGAAVPRLARTVADEVRVRNAATARSVADAVAGVL
ncbi:hypothetical protein GCM10027068_20380 [Prescottella soli]